MADERAIGPLLTDAERLAFIAAARTFLSPAVPFRHQGRTHRGVDCVGLAVAALTQIGRVVVDRQAYGREPLRQQLRELVAANLGPPVPKADMRPGDVVLMRFLGEPSHIGIVGDYLYGGLSLIHAYAKLRKVVEHRMDSEWLGYVTEVFRP